MPKTAILNKITSVLGRILHFIIGCSVLSVGYSLLNKTASPKAKPPLLPELSEAKSRRESTRRRRAEGGLITTFYLYDSSAKKRVVSRQKFSVLQKTAKNCKKKRTFAHLFKPAQNNAKSARFSVLALKNVHSRQIHAKSRQSREANS